MSNTAVHQYLRCCIKFCILHVPYCGHPKHSVLEIALTYDICEKAARREWVGLGCIGNSGIECLAERHSVPGRQVEPWSAFIPIKCVFFPFIRLYPVYPRDLNYHDKGQKNPLSFNNIISNINSAGENYDSECIVAGKNKKCHTEKWTEKITCQERHNTINLHQQ